MCSTILRIKLRSQDLNDTRKRTTVDFWLEASHSRSKRSASHQERPRSCGSSVTKRCLKGADPQHRPLSRSSRKGNRGEGLGGSSPGRRLWRQQRPDTPQLSHSQLTTPLTILEAKATTGRTLGVRAARQNTGYPVKSEYHISNKYFFNIRMSHVIVETYLY